MIKHELIDGWRKCDLSSPPYLFPGDESVIGDSQRSLFRDFDDYVKSRTFGKEDDRSLHVGLLPLPYTGNLERSSIFVLMLNPGLSPGDYFAEECWHMYRSAHIRTLKQKNASLKYPFIYLDPHFAWHPGFEYWHGKLRAIVAAIADGTGVSVQEAMCRLSGKISCLDLIPYHSKSFGAEKLLMELPSAKVMLDFVNTDLVPKAKAGKVLIIVTRSVKYWGLVQHENIILYSGGEARSASLSFNSRGGKAIKSHLGL